MRVGGQAAEQRVRRERVRVRRKTRSVDQQVLGGGIYAPTLLLTDPVRAPAPSAPIDAGVIAMLTPRQCDVLRLLGKGQANKEIARALDISEGTVKIHLAAIFRLLDVRNRT